MKYTLHMRVRRQHIQVEDLQLDVQIAVLKLPMSGVSLETDVVRTIDVDVDLPHYPLSQKMIDHLNKERCSPSPVRAWYIIREENGTETTITPEQSMLDTKAVSA